MKHGGARHRWKIGGMTSDDRVFDICNKCGVKRIKITYTKSSISLIKGGTMYKYFINEGEYLENIPDCKDETI